MSVAPWMFECPRSALTPPPGRPTLPARVRRRNRPQGFQALAAIRQRARAKPETEVLVVVLDDLEQGRESAVMEEAALRVREETLERRRPVALVRRPRGLEVVDADLRRRV